jgi:hypothetical protein
MAYNKIPLLVSEVKNAREFIQTHAPKTYEQRVKNINDVHWAEIVGMANKLVDHLNSTESEQQ